MRLLITIILKDKAVLLIKSNVEESEVANSIIIIKCLHCIDYQTKWLVSAVSVRILSINNPAKLFIYLFFVILSVLETCLIFGKVIGGNSERKLDLQFCQVSI